MEYFIIAVSVCAAAAVFSLAFSAAYYFKAFYNGRRKDVTFDVLTGPAYDPYRDEMLDLIRTAVKIPYEEIYIKACDGKRLYGRLYMRDPSAPFHIQFNGYRGNGLRDFSGGLQLALKSGGNVILTDQRSHGKSDGVTVSFGVRERKDVLRWANYVRDNYGPVPIYLEGISMGAATVLMASDLPLPDTVCGIVADCPYSSPFGIVRKVSRDVLKIDTVTCPFIFAGALLFGHFNILSSSALKSVKEAKVPILLIHGTADDFVPIEMSRSIRDENPGKVTLVEIEGAPHGLSYLKNTPEYEKTLTDFFNKCATQSK
ncbi:MAG: alpha/beta fold hydrolase [Clostridia bacterium]|nr:alpha/beta fold hydrolase [Clostridia bacterium]